MDHVRSRLKSYLCEMQILLRKIKLRCLEGELCSTGLHQCFEIEVEVCDACPLL
jgi:hypothetical protein